MRLPELQLSRFQAVKSALLLAASSSSLVPLPASAIIGEVIGEGFYQADDKSWDLTLPSTKWKISTTVPRAEHPERIFHVSGARDGGAAFEVTVVPSGAKSEAELGKVDAVGAKLSKQFGELKSADVVAGAVKGSQYYVLRYQQSAGGTTTVKLDAKQGRTYMLAVSLPAPSSSEVQTEADALVESFKCFPINIICITQSNSGTTPVAGSCY